MGHRPDVHGRGQPRGREQHRQRSIDAAGAAPAGVLDDDVGRDRAALRDHYTVGFFSGWQTNLDTVGVTQLDYETLAALHAALVDFVPDQNDTVLTAGTAPTAQAGPCTRTTTRRRRAPQTGEPSHLHPDRAHDHRRYVEDHRLEASRRAGSIRPTTRTRPSPGHRSRTTAPASSRLPETTRKPPPTGCSCWRRPRSISPASRLLTRGESYNQVYGRRGQGNGVDASAEMQVRRTDGDDAFEQRTETLSAARSGMAAGLAAKTNVPAAGGQRRTFGLVSRKAEPEAPSAAASRNASTGGPSA